MYNLLVHASGGFWDDNVAVLEAGRFLEYTDKDLTDRLSKLDDKTINELKALPAIFAYEDGRDLPARIGWIESIQQKGREIRIKFRFDPGLPAIAHTKLKEMEWDLDIGKMELYRTHWAVKNADLGHALSEAGLLRKGTAPARRLVQGKPETKTTTRKSIKKATKAMRGKRTPKTEQQLPSAPAKIFIVHGHDNGIKQDVARFLTRLGLVPIILHERPNGGRTLITKFQDESADVRFAVVLMTPDDIGSAQGEAHQRPRSRQNVIFELGFFIGKLGSPHVCALFTSDIEKPSDFDAVVYISYGSNTPWKEELARELRFAQIEFDADKVISP